MRFAVFHLIMALWVLWRFVLPLDLPRRFKAALALLVVVTASFSTVTVFFFGGLLSPEAPRWFLIAGNSGEAVLLFLCGLTALCLLANLTLTALGLMQGDGVWFAMRSLLECMGSILATLLVLGGITVASEWKRIHAPAWKKIAYTLTFPLFMLTYLPISMAALFMKVEWKPIHHSVNLSSLPYPAAKN